jgi:hypothetical protein
MVTDEQLSDHVLFTTDEGLNAVLSSLPAPCSSALAAAVLFIWSFLSIKAPYATLVPKVLQDRIFYIGCMIPGSSLGLDAEGEKLCSTSQHKSTLSPWE